MHILGVGQKANLCGSQHVAGSGNSGVQQRFKRALTLNHFDTQDSEPRRVWPVPGDLVSPPCSFRVRICNALDVVACNRHTVQSVVDTALQLCVLLCFETTQCSSVRWFIGSIKTLR